VLYVLLVGGAVLGVVIGALLIIDSARVMRWNYALNAWYSTRKAIRGLERPVDIKRPVYRWHRALGVLLFAGAVYTLDTLVYNFNTTALAYVFRDLGRPALLALLFETARIALIVGNLAALLAAVVLVFRPSLLKGVEAWADRQYSGRESTKPLEVMRYQPDDFVRARPRVTGVLIVVGSIYILIALGVRLL
jgi:hypothetical protein